MLQAACDQSGLDGAAHHQAETVHHLLRPRQLQLCEVLVAQGAVAHRCQVGGGVYQRELVPGGRARLNHVGWTDHVHLEKARVNQFVFSGGEDVRPDIDVISGRVDDCHGRTAIIGVLGFESLESFRSGRMSDDAG